MLIFGLLIRSNEHFQNTDVFPSSNPIYSRIFQFPVPALYCQSFDPKLKGNFRDTILFIQHLIFLILLNCKPEEELVKSSCDELRKIINGDNPFLTVIPFEKLDAQILPNIFDLLIDKGGVAFQRQLSTKWRSFIRSPLDLQSIHYTRAPLETSKSIPAKVKHRHRTRTATESNQRLPRRKVTHYKGYSAKENIHYTPLSSPKIEIDNALTETVELEMKEGVVLDRRTKDAHILSQNRLSVIEQKLIPWRSNALAKHEVSELVNYLKVKLLDPTSRQIAVYALLSMITSKPYEQLSDFLVTNELIRPLEAENIIDLSEGLWLRRSINMPDSFTATEEQQELLFPHADYVALPLPQELLLALKAIHISHSKWLDEICDIQCASTQLSEFLIVFRKENKLIFRTITPAALRVTCFEKIAIRFNACYASLLLANTEYHSPTVLYYLFAKSDNLQQSYTMMLEDFQFSVEGIATSSDHYIGSELAIDLSIFNNFNREKINFISTLPKTTDIDELVIYHNCFVSYLSSMLLAATGHRLRSEYGFCDFTVDEQLGYLVIADKINYADSAIRIIPMPKLIIEQLASYRNHCTLLSRKFSNNSTLSQALSKVGNKHTYNSPLLFHIDNDEIKIIGNQEIEAYFSPKIELPGNFLRHYFCSALIQNHHYDFTSSFMGHVGHGAHILADFSCLRLADIKSANEAINVLLQNLGFDHIKVCMPKGRLVSPMGKTGEYYKPDYLCRSENKEVAEQIKWSKKLIQPYVKKLRDPKLCNNAVSKIDQLVRSSNSKNISLERRLYWINRWLCKLTKNNRWISTNNPEHTLHVETNLLVLMNESQKITEMINKWLISQDDEAGELSWITKLWISLNINSHYAQPLSKKILLAIQSLPYHHKKTGITWYQLGSKTAPESIYLDSITQVLSVNRLQGIAEEVSVEKINKYIKQTILLKIKHSLILSESAKSSLASLYKLSRYLQKSRHQHHLPLLDAHKAKRIQTTSLSPINAIRWLSQGQLRIESEEGNELAVLPAYVKNKVLLNESDLYASSLKLIDKLHRALHQLVEKNVSSKLKTEEVIISIWAEHIGVNEEPDLSELIFSSSNIDNILVLILVWLIDVAKRPGKENRKYTAPSTVKTYLSNIGKPLLEQAIGENFLVLSSEELTELYIKALDARAVKDRPQRASAFRQFHNFNKEQFGLEGVSWYEVDPNIDKQQQNVNANIMSMTEYEIALELLECDKCSSAREKRINKLILTLCYRAGLRSGEATHLKTSDVDIHNWILHVRTHNSYRLKTLRSNRRIPISSLFSESEKKLLSEQLQDALQNLTEGENNWLFCDLNNQHCLVDRFKHIQRVTQAMKIATGDNTIRLHNARHSFANYLLMVLVALNYAPAIKCELVRWARTTNMELFIDELSEILLSTTNHKLNLLYAISVLMGHSTPKTTLNNYIHCLDFMLLAQSEITLYKQVTVPDIAKKVGIERTNVNKILQRGECAQYGLKALIARLDFNDYDFKKVELPPRKLNELSDLALNKTANRYNNFNNIERVIRAAEENNSIIDIMTKYYLSHDEIQSIINETIQIKQITAYSGTNISANSQYLLFSNSPQKVEMTAKYAHQEEFQNLLKNAAKLRTEELTYLSGIFTESYDKRNGLVVSRNDTSLLVKISKQLGYQAVVSKELTPLRSKFGMRKGYSTHFIAIADSKKNYSRESNHDNRFTHCLFLIAVLTSSLNKGNYL